MAAVGWAGGLGGNVGRGGGAAVDHGRRKRNPGLWSAIEVYGNKVMK